jgi:ABC-type transport system involved in multi-copper enzyme maturation permease subunit
MRIFRSGIRTLLRRPATYLTFGILAGLLVLIIVAVTATGDELEGPEAFLIITFPFAYEIILTFIIGLGGLFAVTYGAAVAGSEWSWGTLKAVVARGESRSRYILLTFAAVAAFVLLGILVSFAIGVAAAYIGALVADVNTAGVDDTEALRDLPELFGRGWYAMVEQGAIGFAVATLARSQLAGIGIGIALFFGEAFAGIFLPDIVPYLPFSAASAAVGIGGGPFEGGPGTLSQETAMIVVGLWLAGSLIVAAIFSERADITG